MKLGVASDLHLNFLKPTKQVAFLNKVDKEKYDALLLPGDISDANGLMLSLNLLDTLNIPVYFVLGNHDFYHASIEFIRLKAIECCKASKNLIYLSDSKDTDYLDKYVVPIIGHDGWYDGGFGDYKKSRFELNDFNLIGEFIGKDKWQRFELMENLALEGTFHLQRHLEELLLRKKFLKHIIILTHVPPFEECCVTRYNENPEHSIPFYCSKVIGETIKEYSDANKDVEFNVFCGHTHREWSGGITDNLTVHVSNAEYGFPKIKTIEVDI